MSSIDEIRSARLKKLELLKKAGVDPYPADAKRELSFAEAVQNFDQLAKEKTLKWLSGRVMSIRSAGAIIFITLYDGTASFQALFKKDVLSEEKLKFWNKVVDIGDFVEVQGTFFVTQRRSEEHTSELQSQSN